MRVPIYELPGTGDPFDDFCLPFIVVYSAEAVGLSPVPPLEQIISTRPGEEDADASTTHKDYLVVSSLPFYIPGPPESLSNLMVPEFRCLIQSEMHVLLQHADHPPTWGQHMAQLSEPVRSRGCERGIDSLCDLVQQPRLLRFARWVQADLRGHSDRESLQSIRDEYRETGRRENTRIVES